MADETTSMEWWRWLKKAGIVRDGDAVTRVVIDIKCDEVVCIYVERLDTKRLIELSPPSIEGTKITVV